MCHDDHVRLKIIIIIAHIFIVHLVPFRLRFTLIKLATFILYYIASSMCIVLTIYQLFKLRTQIAYVIVRLRIRINITITNNGERRRIPQDLSSAIFTNVVT